MTTVRAAARMRARNQLTLPDPVVTAAGIQEGDAFVVEVDQREPDVVRLRLVRASYAGALRGLYDDTREYLDQERRSWGERDRRVP
ncbi:MAG: hypothetical protein LH650_11750 [Chloroflexi bacterium]|nr:hypothetical protein [Chloroflexota bacterium]